MTRSLALFLFGLAAIVAACGGGKGAVRGTTRHLEPAQIADKATPSLVVIRTPKTIGTGFVVWRDGRIATNLHILQGAREAVVTLADGREFREMEVVVDATHDLAILRVAATNLIPLPLGDSTTVRRGDRVVAIGNPLGLEASVSDGLVSGIRRLGPQTTLLQVSAPISPGSSGGPLFNDRGEVIGISTLFSAEGQNLNFGVPVNDLKRLLLAEKWMSLTELARQMDVGLLAGCTGEDVSKATQALVDAIDQGAPVYNKGDHEACFKIYEKAALELTGSIQCEGIKQTLLAGLALASQEAQPGAKAWAMRNAFDRILDAVKQALDGMRRGAR